MAIPSRIPSLALVDLFLSMAAGPPNDLTLKVAGGVPVKIFAQGATVAASVAVPAITPTPVSVAHTGALFSTFVGPDGLPWQGQAYVNGDSTKPLGIVSVVQSPSPIITVSNTGNALTLVSGDRLMVSVPQSVFYSDPNGMVAIGTTLTSNATTGRVTGYVRDYRFDLLVTGVTASCG